MLYLFSLLLSSDVRVLTFCILIKMRKPEACSRVLTHLSGSLCPSALSSAAAGAQEGLSRVWAGFCCCLGLRGRVGLGLANIQHSPMAELPFPINVLRITAALLLYAARAQVQGGTGELQSFPIKIS